jgi:hypothetical protein
MPHLHFKKVTCFTYAVRDPGVIFYQFSNPDKSCSVFFNISHQVKRFGKQFISDGRHVIILFKILNGQVAVDFARIGEDNPIVKYFDDDIRCMLIITMYNRV